MRAWRDPNKPDGLVFATSKGNRVPWKYCMRWLRKTVVGLKDQFSVSELRSLSGGTMHKGWSMWAKHSTDKSVKEVATRVM